MLQRPQADQGLLASFHTGTIGLKRQAIASKQFVRFKGRQVLQKTPHIHPDLF